MNKTIFLQVLPRGGGRVADGAEGGPGVRPPDAPGVESHGLGSTRRRRQHPQGIVKQIADILGGGTVTLLINKK